MTTWRKLWIAWSVLGLGSLAAILAAQELGVVIGSRAWWLWAGFGLGSFAVLELWGLFRTAPLDTFSEQIWAMQDARSIVIFACAWGAFAVFTGNVWPSFPAAALLWCAYHFWREGPYVC